MKKEKQAFTVTKSPKECSADGLSGSLGNTDLVQVHCKPYKAICSLTSNIYPIRMGKPRL